MRPIASGTGFIRFSRCGSVKLSSPLMWRIGTYMSTEGSVFGGSQCVNPE